MPVSTNPALNAFADERVRPLADLVTELRLKIDSYLTDHDAYGITTMISNDTPSGAADLMGTQDSRIPITGTQILNFRAAMVKLQANIETDLVSGVGATAACVCNAIQVNGSNR